MQLSRLVTVFCATLLGAACTAQSSRTAVAPDVDNHVAAAGGEHANAPGSATTAEDEDPLECKSVVQTGTRVAQRTCMRRSEKEAQQRDAHELLEAVQRRGVQTGNVTKD
jgi:hypothetical protein